MQKDMNELRKTREAEKKEEERAKQS